jgi:hypothetical protein
MERYNVAVTLRSAFLARSVGSGKGRDETRRSAYLAGNPTTQMTHHPLVAGLLGL